MQTPTLTFLKSNARWLLAGAILAFCSSFGQTFFIGVFAGEIRTEFGLSHGTWGSIYGAGTLLSGLTMIWAGTLTDKFRVRTLGTAALACLSLACLAMAYVNAVWMLVPTILLLRLAGQGMSMHIAMTAMARWFVATRGRAIGVASMGIILGEALLPLGIVSLMGGVSWRALWMIAAVVVLLPIPLLWKLLRTERTPQSAADQTHAPGLFHRHWTRPEVLRHPLFWSLVPLLLGPAACFTAMILNQTQLVEVKGWQHIEFVSLLPMFTACGTVALIASGWLLDRVGTGRMMPLLQLPMAVGFFMMSRAETVAEAGLALVMMAMTVGANNTVSSAFWAEYFGNRYIGAIRAATTAVMVIGSAIGPGLTGYLLDKGVTLDQQFQGMSLYFIAASAMAWFALRGTKENLPSRAGIYDA